jgi:hypothetical protein
MAELNTYGDLKKVIKAISLKQKGEKIGNIALGTLMGLIPGAEAAKTTFDFIKAAFSKPDVKKTGTWLDKLDVDDQMSAIVDDTVENGFMKAMAATIERESDDKPLEQDFNMNAKMVDYLKKTYAGRTVAGIKENKEMDIKEYIKSLIRKELEETSTTGAIGVGAGPIMTPYAFAKKGQKKNAATKYAEKEGWKVTKGETTMPSDSKVKDYVSLTGKKKKGVKIYKEYSDYDKPSAYGAKSGYSAASGYTGPSSSSKGGGYYSGAVKENKMNSLSDIIEQELLNEVSYSKFKNEVKFRTKSERLHKAIREVKRKIQEIDRIVEYTSRMKQELSEDGGINYWKATQKNVSQISEMVNQLNNKIKNLNQ